MLPFPSIVSFCSRKKEIKKQRERKKRKRKNKAHFCDHDHESGRAIGVKLTNWVLIVIENSYDYMYQL